MQLSLLLRKYQKNQSIKVYVQFSIRPRPQSPRLKKKKDGECAALRSSG